MPSVVYTLNTTQQVPQTVQDRVWKELLRAGAEHCTDFKIGYPANPTLAQDLEAFGRSGMNHSKGIEGNLTSAFLAWLISNNAREKLDWIEFYNSGERCFEHYDQGQQVTVILNIEEAVKLKRALQAQGIDPDITLFTSQPDLDQ